MGGLKLFSKKDTENCSVYIIKRRVANNVRQCKVYLITRQCQFHEYLYLQKKLLFLFLVIFKPSTKYST